MQAEMLRRLNERSRADRQGTFRDRAAVRRFFDGLEVLQPGVVTPPQWRPDPGDVIPGRGTAAWLAAHAQHTDGDLTLAVKILREVVPAR